MFPILQRTPQSTAYLKSAPFANLYIQLHVHHPLYYNQAYYVHKSFNLNLLRRFMTKTFLGFFNNFDFWFNKQQLLNEDEPVQNIFPYDQNSLNNSFFVEVQIGQYSLFALKYHFVMVSQVLFRPMRYKFFQMQSFEKHLQQLNKLKTTVNKKKTIQFHPSVEDIQKQYMNAQIPMHDILDYDLRNNLSKNIYKGVQAPKLLKYLNIQKDKKMTTDAFYKGHMIYFKLITLEDMQYDIAGSVEGFTIINAKSTQAEKSGKNNSQDQKQLDAQGFYKQSQPFVSLFDLIKSVSKKFETQLEAYLNSYQLDVLTYIETCNDQKPSPHWLTSQRPDQTQVFSGQIEISDKVEFVNWSMTYIDEVYQYKEIIENLCSTEDENPNPDRENCRLDYFLRSRARISNLQGILRAVTAPLSGTGGNSVSTRDQSLFYVESRFDACYLQQDIYMRGFKQQYSKYSNKTVQFKSEHGTFQLAYVKTLPVIHKILLTQNIHPIQAAIVETRGRKYFSREHFSDKYLKESCKHCIFQTGPLKSQKFQNCFRKIAKELNLQEDVDYYLRVQGRQQKLQNAVVSPFMFGMSFGGFDYISEIHRFSVRDLNYLGSQNQRCFFRFQLLKKFIAYKEKRGQKYQKFNVNIECDDTPLVQSQKLNSQISTLFEVANYVRNQAIPELISALKREGTVAMTDCKKVSFAFHKYGVNMRYLGQVAEHQYIKDSPQIQIFLRRIILTRTLKQYFRVVMRQTKTSMLRQTVAHVLNCVFSKVSVLKQLEEKCFKIQLEQKEKKRKKIFLINNDKNQRPKVKSKRNYIKYIQLGPKQVWKQIFQICKARFNFDLCPSIYMENQEGVFSYPYTKLATLQDLCNCLGIQLYSKSYDIIQKRNENQVGQTQKEKNKLQIKKYRIQKQSKGMQLPFQAEDIVQFRVITQYINQQFPEYGNFSLEGLVFMQQYAAFDMDNGLMWATMRARMQPLQNQDVILRDMEENQLIFQRLFEAEIMPFDFLVSQSFTRLGMAKFEKKQYEVALYYSLKSLHMMLTTYGQTYPHLFMAMMKVSQIYQVLRLPKFAIRFLHRILEIIQPIYGEWHLQISIIHVSLASLYYNQNQMWDQCIYHQQKARDILVKRVGPQEPPLVSAQKVLKMYIRERDASRSVVKRDVPTLEKVLNRLKQYHGID